MAYCPVAAEVDRHTSGAGDRWVEDRVAFHIAAEDDMLGEAMLDALENTCQRSLLAALFFGGARLETLRESLRSKAMDKLAEIAWDELADEAGADE